ncbi:MAG: hypothetical protein H7224_09315 [Polaromonas sp.]|nr:hypothetical protein [Polaromonas sp.]
MRAFFFCLPAAALCLMTACASGPQPPEWQLEAKSAMDRAVAAYLEGDSRVEQAEISRARAALARTGRADLLANVELLRCAPRVASLVFEPCEAFESLRPEATAGQRAYADYLRGQLQPQDAALLPEAQRGVATDHPTAALGQKDPLSQLVAAGVLLQAGKATASVHEAAVNTASAQGWRRPLLAWLGLQLRQAEQASQADEVARLQRKIAIVGGLRAARAKDLP